MASSFRFPSSRCWFPAAGAGLALVELSDTAGWLTLAVIAAGVVGGWVADKGGGSSRGEESVPVPVYDARPGGGG